MAGMKPPMIVNEDLVEQGFRTEIPPPAARLDCLVASRVGDENSMLFVPEVTGAPAREDSGCSQPHS
ncbi:MAG: hypothetical protein M1370_02945 [Bacteroidetes bacterium]|nr:hypothetical protein [Bacteroidota bacterium]